MKRKIKILVGLILIGSVLLLLSWVLPGGKGQTKTSKKLSQPAPTLFPTPIITQELIEKESNPLLQQLEEIYQRLENLDKSLRQQFTPLPTPIKIKF